MQQPRKDRQTAAGIRSVADDDISSAALNLTAGPRVVSSLSWQPEQLEAPSGGTCVSGSGHDAMVSTPDFVQRRAV